MGSKDAERARWLLLKRYQSKQMEMEKTYITARVADIPPVGPTKDHVKTVNGDTSSVVVLVEDSLEFHVDESGALLKANTARRVEAASLEFRDSVRSTGALL